jgi:hypothetical protein
MSLLTEQEIREAHEKHSNEFLFEDTINFARAVEAKVIEKIKAQGPDMLYKEIEMKPELNPGEIYVGRINDQHIVLLPGDNDNANWQDALDWAKSIGGDLPNRIEQAMLWANHRDQFQEDWYWSNETHEQDSAYAWCQDFGYGEQISNHKDDVLCRARAVRRLPI